MRRFIVDAGIAGLYLDRKHGVFDQATTEVARVRGVRRCYDDLGSTARIRHWGRRR
jgi:hypothetical protein